MHLALGQQAQFNSGPNFVSLLADVCSEGGLTALGAGVDERNRLAEELNGWKAIASLQAEELRNLKLAPRMVVPRVAQTGDTDEPVEEWTDLEDGNQGGSRS